MYKSWVLIILAGWGVSFAQTDSVQHTDSLYIKAVKMTEEFNEPVEFMDDDQRNNIHYTMDSENEDQEHLKFSPVDTKGPAAYNASSLEEAIILGLWRTITAPRKKKKNNSRMTNDE